MDEIDEVAAAVDTVATALETDAAVAHAEVGGFVRDRTEVILTHETTRSTHSFLDTGVWCRVLADGASGYRQTTRLDGESLEQLAETTVRSARQLGQERPEQYDPETAHRATHGGWAANPLSSIDPEDIAGRLADARDDACDDVTLDRARLEYTGEHLTSMLATTTDSLLTTTLDRAKADLSLSLGDATVRRRVGSTDGSTIDRVPELFEGAIDDAARLDAHDASSVESSRRTIVLGPSAAGQLVAAIVESFEADVALSGLTPFELGDRIAPPSISIADGIEAGSWAARAFDAEGRPTTPVQLVDDGIARNYLHSVSSASILDGPVAGSLVPSIGFETAPRIHARHLDVAAGDRTLEELLADADAYVERFRGPWKREGLLRKLRSGWAPPGVNYTPQLAEQIDDEEIERWRGQRSLPIAEGYRIDDGEFVGRLEDVTYEFTFDDLPSIDGIGASTETISGVAEKHKSQLPYAVSAPAIRLSGRLD